MAKTRNYGYKTPVRRTTNNVTGHKVGGEYSGGDCKIVSFKTLELKKTVSFEFSLNTNEAVSLFGRDLGIAAIGGYFLSNKDAIINLSIESNKIIKEESFNLKSGIFEKIGIDYEFNPSKYKPGTLIKLKIEFRLNEATDISYSLFSYGFINYKYFLENDVYEPFSNSKKTICFPEQFYFFEETIFEGSVNGDPLILKSCNRCQRFLPINHIYERNQLAFSNHCSTKAPCTHGNFSNYKIVDSVLKGKELISFIDGSPYELNGEFVISHYGHQLECKACKKFYVNSALNKLRTFTQHREDSLRRRAFELLIRDLLKIKWIYHTFRTEHKLEFDQFIWEKFGGKCFNCGTGISSPKKMDLDHTMPLVHLYPLDETATCLCPKCNSLKSDLFPVEFYKAEQLKELSHLTGLPLELLTSRKPNQVVIDLLLKNVVWFFEEFLTFDEYTKVREGKTAAASILHSLQKVVKNSKKPYNLLEEYEKTKV